MCSYFLKKLCIVQDLSQHFLAVPSPLVYSCSTFGSRDLFGYPLSCDEGVFGHRYLALAVVVVEVLQEDVVVGVYDINHRMVRRGDLMIVRCSLHCCNSSCELA